jgi:hypothetical protein
VSSGVEARSDCTAEHRTPAFAVRLSVVLAAIAVSAVLATAAQAVDPSHVLALRYEPVVRLVEQMEPCAHGEAYQPTDVRRVLGSADVALRGPWDTINIVKVAPTAADLAQGLFDYHLDFPVHAVAPGCTYDLWSHRINQGRAPRMYARVATERAYAGELALQYWFFYVFNDFNDKHEGDWEMVQLDFDAASSADALSTKPSLVGYSQHDGAESAHWGDSKLQIIDGTHPVVYPALGSHANYYTSALHLGRSAAEGVGCDDTSAPSRELHPKVSLVPTDRAAYLRHIPGWASRVAGARNTRASTTARRVPPLSDSGPSPSAGRGKNGATRASSFLLQRPSARSRPVSFAVPWRPAPTCSRHSSGIRRLSCSHWSPSWRPSSGLPRGHGGNRQRRFVWRDAVRGAPSSTRLAGCISATSVCFSGSASSSSHSVL